jgi:hypothetical protein
MEPSDRDCDAMFKPEELCCRHCLHSLYGLTDTRCPECGSAFDWAEVEGRALRWRRSPLFEHHYPHDAARTLLHTWRLAALSPWRVWRAYQRSDPPRVRPLILFLLLQLLVFLGGWETVAVPLGYGMNAAWSALMSEQGEGISFSYRPHLGLRGKALTLIWLATTFVALQLMFQSKRRVRATWRHVFRVFVHGTALGSLCTVVWCAAEAGLDLTFFFREDPASFGGWPNMGTYQRLGNGLLIVFGVLTWVSIAYGLREHLAMKRSLVVVMAAMLIGGLIANAVDAAAWWYW